MNLMFILSQICGVIALIVGCCGYFSKTKTKFLIFQSICDVFYAGSYLFLGSFVAGFVTILSIIKSIIFYFCQKHNFKYDYLFLIIFIILNIIITIVFWKSPIDIVPLITSSLFVYIMFIKNIQTTRCLTLIPNSILFVYNISLSAYANGALSFIEIIVTIVAIIQFNKKLKNKNLENKKMDNNDLSKLIDLTKNCDALLFYFDGTLLDSEKYHMKAHSKVLSEITGKDIQLDTISFQKYIGKCDEQIFDEYKKDFSIEFDKEEMITKKVLTARDLLLSKEVEIFDYFFELLKNKNEKKFYIVSNQDERILFDVLKEKGILEYFDKVFCLPSMNIQKVDFYNQLDNFIDFKDCCVFEDSATIIKLAETMNFKTVGIETSTNKNKLENACDLILKY